MQQEVVGALNQLEFQLNSLSKAAEHQDDNQAPTVDKSEYSVTVSENGTVYPDPCEENLSNYQNEANRNNFLRFAWFTFGFILRDCQNLTFLNYSF